MVRLCANYAPRGPGLQIMNKYILVLLVVLGAPSLGAISALDILKKADEHRSPAGDFSFVVKASEFKAKTLSKETVYKVFSKEGRYSLIETIYPERMLGRKLLMKENALWLYLPNVHRPTRVSMQQRLTGEVSNGDIARTNFVDDYTPKLLGQVKWKKRNVYRLALTAKSAEASYRFIELLVDAKNFFPLHADFFAISGKKLKAGEFSEFKNVLGKMRSTRFVVTDALQADRYTRLDYSRFHKESLSESFFNKESIVD